MAAAVITPMAQAQAQALSITSNASHKERVATAASDVNMNYFRKVVMATPSKTVKLLPLKGTLWDLEGNICAGKTSKGSDLAKEFRASCSFGCEFMSERMNVKLLQQFNTNPEKYGYMLQVYAASQCNTMHLKARYEARSLGRLAMVDRGGWGNYVFEQVNHDLGHITDGEHEAYASMIMDFEPIEIDAVLYIDVTPATCLERNRKRAIKAESGLTLEYLDALDRHYCKQVVNRMLDGTSAVLVLHDPGTFLDTPWVLEQMARFVTYRSAGYLPGRDFLIQNWEKNQYGNIVALPEPERRRLMVELSNVQLEEMRITALL